MVTTDASEEDTVAGGVGMFMEPPVPDVPPLQPHAAKASTVPMARVAPTSRAAYASRMPTGHRRFRLENAGPANPGVY